LCTGHINIILEYVCCGLVKVVSEMVHRLNEPFPNVMHKCKD
jgi:hypothetical protein